MVLFFYMPPPPTPNSGTLEFGATFPCSLDEAVSEVETFPPPKPTFFNFIGKRILFLFTALVPKTPLVEIDLPLSPVFMFVGVTLVSIPEAEAAEVFSVTAV